MNGMSVSFRDIDDITVATVLGQDITYEVGEALQSRLRAPGGGGEPASFVLDLSSVTFLGSIGLTVLVVFLKRVKTAGGHLVAKPDVVDLSSQTSSRQGTHPRADRIYTLLDVRYLLSQWPQDVEQSLDPAKDLEIRPIAVLDFLSDRLVGSLQVVDCQL